MDIIQEKKAEERLVSKIRSGDEAAFEQLFFEYFYDLCSYAFQLTQSNDRAKDIVQEVFYKLWKRRSNWSVHTSLKAYLFRSVRNEALNQVKHQQHLKEVREKFSDQKDDLESSDSKSDDKLLEEIWKIVPQMAKRRRAVFVLHRKHGLSYKEIAQVLNISRKTVENHMGLALDDIRNALDMNQF